MRRVSMCVLLLAAMAGSAVADGPETGLVSGVVTDASGTPLPGVSVIITGDRGEKATVTERGRLVPFRAAGARQLRHQGPARGHGNGGRDGRR